MREESGILVSVLDLTQAEREAEQFYIEEQRREFRYTPEVNLRVMGRWGVIQTNLGFFAINSLGVGQQEPINKFGSDLSLSFYHYSEGLAIFGPLISRPFTIDLLINSQVSDEVPLEDFIENCLPICDKNYYFWKEFFKPKQDEDDVEGFEGEFESFHDSNSSNEEYKEDNPKEAQQTSKKTVSCPTLFTPKQLVKYGKFLVKKKCDCKDSEELIKVTKNVCSCGNKNQHSHCSKCGGVL